LPQVLDIRNREATNLGDGYITGIMCLVLSYHCHIMALMNIKVQGTLDLFDNTPGLEATPFMLIDKLKTESRNSETLV
jgi:hypothetical protein